MDTPKNAIVLVAGVPSVRFRMKSHILIMASLLFYVTRALKVNLKSKGLTIVPQDINPDVTDINLDRNEIRRITSVDFALYKEILILSIIQSHVTFIEDGAFNYNSKLQNLNVLRNRIIHLPQSFGSAARSLIALIFWNGLEESALSKLNFSELTKLDNLNIGCVDFSRGKLNAAALPSSLRRINLNCARLPQYPKH